MHALLKNHLKILRILLCKQNPTNHHFDTDLNIWISLLIKHFMNIHFSFLAKWMESDNERYEYLTTGKGKNRKVLNAQVQTLDILKKTKNTDTPKIHKTHNYAFASNWDMYDSYAKDQDAGHDLREEDDDEIEDRNILESFSHKQSSTESQAMYSLFKNPRFQDALIVMERLLANNNFNIQQKRFRGLTEQDPFREDIDYKYTLDLLWTFANENTKGK